MEDLKTRAIDRLRQLESVVLPSLLLCDFGDLKTEIARLEQAGIQALHLDVMDGHFVPNLTYGMPIVAAIRRLTQLPLDVHLMISNPRQYIAEFVKAGADSLTIHAEIEDDVAELLDMIRQHGVGAGLAVNPATPLDGLDAALDRCDLVLAMSVQPGFGGQKFNPVALEKLQQLRASRPNVMLEVDGGVNATTIRRCKEAGASLFVVGSAIFGQPDYESAVAELMAALES
ncbi:MAG: ribulose-phosphate 3-epimerase [Planctomycetota bacterium]|nr:MAG: ribulose-phosphate 3-epimerase [Planctomycetota bacterium]